MIVDEAGEEEMHPEKNDQDGRDIGNTNIGKEQSLEDIEMQLAETEETLEEEAIEEALQGIDLAKITEEWKKEEGINAISKQQLQKIEGAYLLQEELKLKTHNPTQESTASKRILANVPVEGLNLKGSSRN